LKALGVVDRFGFGLVRAKQALAENGNPPLAYEFVESFVLFKMEPAQ
jgi:predicted HTH transcriptional regulator